MNATAAPNHLQIARGLLGLSEIRGKAHAPEVLALFADAGFSGIKDDETAWCAAYVGGCLKRAGIQPSGSLLARSYLDYGTPVDLDDAKPGDIVVFPRGNSTWQGHVAFFLEHVGKRIRVIGGNQGKIGAVTETTYPAGSVIGVRRPPSPEAPKSDWPLDSGSRGPRVRHLQETLDGLGYHMVGKVDGRFGRNTRDAVMAIQADNEIAVTGKVTADLYARLESLPPRELSRARATTTEAELVETSRIAGEASKAKRDALIYGGPAAAGVATAVGDKLTEDPASAIDTATGAIDKAGQVSRTAEQGLDLVERWTGGRLDVETVLILAGIALVAFFGVQLLRSRRIIAARLEDERTGKTR